MWGASYYRKFIHIFSYLARLLADRRRKTVVSCDASRHDVGGDLSQYQEDIILWLVAYVSRRLKDTEGRWSVSDTGLLSVVYTVTYFRPFFFLHSWHLTIFNNHASLQYYENVKSLSSRLNGLAMKLVDYDFKIKHKLGSTMSVPDSLSIYSEDQQIKQPPIKEEFNINIIKTINMEKGWRCISFSD